MRQSSGLQRVRLKYLTLANVIAIFAGFEYFSRVFKIFKSPPLDDYILVAYLFVFAYAIIRYRLMDINLVLTRTGIFIATYSLVLGIPFALAFGWKEHLKTFLGESWWLVPLITSTILATAGPFIYLFIQKRAEDRLLKEQRAYQATLQRASAGMGRVKDLKRLLDLIVHIVVRAVKLEHGEVFLWHEQSNQFVLKALKGRHFADLKNTTLSLNSPLILHFQKNKEALVTEEIKQRSSDYADKELQDIEAILSDLEAALAVPSFIEDKLIAILITGRKKSGKLYSQDDLSAFTILANQAALAIENLKSVEEMKKAQEKLFHAEKLAYVGQLASSIVHEVRNPITAIKTFVEYLPDKFRAQDTGFLERFEKIVPNEVKRIENLVRELLDLAKPRQIKKEEIKVAEIVNRTLELLKDNIQLRGIHLENECLTEDDRILGDEEQIQQVMLNLILNALDAMEEGGTLKVKVEGKDNRIVAAVRDTGCGISPEDLKLLFTPFHTTKKNGVGLGLIVTQEIVKQHGGEIQVESAPGRGTQFSVVFSPAHRLGDTPAGGHNT